MEGEANGYVIKDKNLEEFTSKFSQLLHYWFGIQNQKFIQSHDFLSLDIYHYILVFCLFQLAYLCVRD